MHSSLPRVTSSPKRRVVEVFEEHLEVGQSETLSGYRIEARASRLWPYVSYKVWSPNGTNLRSFSLLVRARQFVIEQARREPK